MTAMQEHADLGRIFVEHRAHLRRAAVRIVGSAELADDVMQDAYVKLIGANTAVVTQPLGYCLQLVRNMALDHCRRATLEAGLFACEEEWMHVPAHGGAPEQRAISHQSIAIVELALSRLPQRTRKAFELYRLGGLTQRDIATEMALSVGTVNGLIQEAVGALMDCRHVVGLA